MKPIQALRLRSGLVADDLSDIPMVGRYELWREVPQVTTTPISSWTDLSGNGNHLTNTGTARPTWNTPAINGLPSVLFDGVNDFLMTASIPAMNNTDTRWYYLLHRYSSYPAPAFPAAMSGDNTAANGVGDLVIYGGTGTQMLLRWVYASTANNTYAPSVAVGVFRLASLIGDGTNVVQKITGGGSQSAAQSADQPNGTFKLMLGATSQGAPANFFTGQVAALFMGNTVLTSAQKLRIEAYVLRVFGISA